MNLLRTSLTVASLLSLAITARADVVVMKDGKKYESATVLSETADSVTFKYMLTPRIPDTRTEPKANIQQIVKQRPEELEVVPLRKLVPAPDLLTADKYEGLIQDTLRPFIAKYPGSPEAKEVEGMVASLQTEKEKVISGQLKFDGKWLSAEEVKRDGHSIDASRMRSEINGLAAEGKLREALNLWQRFIARDEGFKDTEQYLKAIPEITKLYETYKAKLDQMLAEQPGLALRRQSSLKGLVEPDLGRMNRAIKAEVDAFQADVDVQKRTQQRYPAAYKYDLDSIQDALKNVVDDMTKHASIDVAKTTAVVNAIVAARRYLSDRNLDAAMTALNEAGNSSSRDPDMNGAISKLKTQSMALRKELTAKRAAVKAYGDPTNLSSAAKATATEKDDSVAEMLAEARAKKESGSDVKGDDKKGSSSSAPTSSSKTSSKKSVADLLTKTSSDSASSEDEGGLMGNLPLIGGGVVVLLLAVMFLQKKKS